MTLLDKSHRFNESTLNRKLDDLDAWLQEIAPSPSPVLLGKKPAVNPAIQLLNDSVYISEGSTSNITERPKQIRPTEGALEAILNRPPPVNSRATPVNGRKPSNPFEAILNRPPPAIGRKPTNPFEAILNRPVPVNGRKPTHASKDEARIPKGRGTSSNKEANLSGNEPDKIRAIWSNESLSTNRERSPHRKDEISEDETSKTSYESLSTDAERGEGSSKGELSTRSERSIIRRDRSDEHGGPNKDEPSARGEHSIVRRNRSIEILSASAQHGGSGKDELSASSDHSSLRRNRSIESLSASAQHGGSRKDELSASSEHSSLRRNRSIESLSNRAQHGGSRKDGLSASSEHSSLRRNRSIESLSNRVQHGGSRKDELSAGSEHSILRRNRSNERLSTTAPLSRGSSHRNELPLPRNRSNERLSTTASISRGSSIRDELPLPHSMISRRIRSSETLRSRRSGNKESSAGDMQSKMMRRITSHESLSRKTPRCPVTSNTSHVQGGSHHSTLRRIRSIESFSTSVNRSPGSGIEGEATGNEHGIIQRIRSTENLSKNDKRSTRRSNKDNKHGTIRRSSRSTENLSRSDQASPSMGLPLNSTWAPSSRNDHSREDQPGPLKSTIRDAQGGSYQSTIRPIRSNESLPTSANRSPGSGSEGETSGNEHGLIRRIRSTESLSRSDKRSPRKSTKETKHGMIRRSSRSTENLTKSDQPDPTMGLPHNSTWEQSSRNDLSRSEHRTKGDPHPPCDLRPLNRSRTIGDEGDGRNRDRLVVHRGRRIGRLADKSSRDDGDELMLHQCATSGEDNHPPSVNPRRVAGRHCDTGGKRSSRSRRKSDSRPTSSFMRAVSVGNLGMAQSDISEDIEVRKPLSSLSLMEF